MSGLTYLSERAVERAIELATLGTPPLEIMRSLSNDQFEELLALMRFGQSKNAKFGFEWHKDHYRMPFDGVIFLSAEDLRRGLMRLRAEAKLVYSAA